MAAPSKTAAEPKKAEKPLHFDPRTYGLLVDRINEDNELEFVSPEGAIYQPTPTQTALVSADHGEVASVSKYNNTIRATPFEAVNPRKLVAGGCERCGNRVVSYQRLGETKKVVHVCLCGHKW